MHARDKRGHDESKFVSEVAVHRRLQPYVSAEAPLRIEILRFGIARDVGERALAGEGGHADVIVIPSELVPYLERAIAESPSEPVFPRSTKSTM